MAKKRTSQEDVDMDLNTVSSMADRLGLKDEDRDHYVHKHMTDLGHRRHASYGPGGDDDDDEEEVRGYFRRSRTGTGSRRSRDDDDW
jgi:hypothetical protein